MYAIVLDHELKPKTFKIGNDSEEDKSSEINNAMVNILEKHI